VFVLASVSHRFTDILKRFQVWSKKKGTAHEGRARKVTTLNSVRTDAQDMCQGSTNQHCSRR